MNKILVTLLILSVIFPISVFADLRILSAVPNSATVNFPATGSALVPVQVKVSNELNTGATTLPGLIGWWPGDGNADDLVNSNDGLTINGASFTTGKIHQAFNFDGTNDYVVISHSNELEPTSAITIEAWIKASTLGGFRCILTNSDHATTEGYSLCLDDAGLISFRMGTGFGSVNYYAMGKKVLKDNLWHHVAATYDGSTMRVYVDGVDNTQTPISLNQNIVYNNRQTNIGADSFGIYVDRFFSGQIDEMALYNRVLSASEIKSIFDAGANGKYVPSPVSSVLINMEPQTQNGVTLSDLIRINSLSYGAANAKTATLTLNVPRNILPGTYNFNVRALDESKTTNFDDQSFSLIINPAASFTLLHDGNDLGSSPISFLGERGKVTDYDLTIKNVGNVALNNIQVAHNFITTSSDSTDGNSNSLIDEDGDKIELSITPATISSLPVGGTTTVTLRADTDSSFDASKLSSTLTITAAGFPSLTQNFEIDVRPLACPSSSSSNKLEIDIVDPDSDKDFQPGDTVHLRVDIDNKVSDDKRIKVEVLLYNSDKNKKIDTFSITKKISNDDTETFLFDITLNPDDINKDDSYVLYIIAYDRDNEDVSCIQDTFDLGVDTPEHSIIIDALTVNPSIAQCGTTATASMTLTNIGDNYERAYISATNQDLGLGYFSPQVEISDSTDENTVVHTFTFNVPANANAGPYPISVKATYSSQKTEEQLVLNTACTVPGSSNKQQTETGADSISVTSGNKFLDTTNTGFDDKGFFEKFSSGSYKVPTSVWVLIDIVLALIIVSAVIMVFRRK